MQSYSAFLSRLSLLILFLFSPFSGYEIMAGEYGAMVNVDETPASEYEEPAGDSGIKRWNINLSTPKAAVSGFFLIRDEDDSIAGSIINEFGISLADFRFNPVSGKVKFINLTGFLNKWYLKKLLAKDLSLALKRLTNPSPSLSSPKGYDVSVSSDTVVIHNLKYDITYQFSPLSDETDK